MQAGPLLGFDDDEGTIGAADGASGVKLVNVPIDLTRDLVLTQGSATALMSGNYPENDDGTHFGLQVSVQPSATFDNYVRIRRIFRGTAAAVRLLRSGAGSGNEATPFGVFVDGIPIDCDWSQGLLSDQQQTSTIPGVYRTILLGTNFGNDVEHDLLIAIPCDPTSVRNITFLGYAFDEAVGYRPLPRGFDIQAPQSLVPVAGFFFGPTSGTSYGFSIAIGFYYSNTSASPVTIKVNGVSSPAQGLPLVSITVPANSDGYCALPGPVPDGFSITASRAGAIVAASTTSGSPTLTVTGVTSGALAVGDRISGNGIPTGTTIQAFGTGSGGTGTYTMSANASATASGVTVNGVVITVTPVGQY